MIRRLFRHLGPAAAAPPSKIGAARAAEPPADLPPLNTHRKSRPRPAPLAATFPFAALLASGASPSASTPPAAPRLAALAISVAGEGSTEPGGLRPKFHPETFHYAIRCDDPETLSVSGAASGETAAVTLNRTPVPRAFEEREVILRHDQDLAVVVSDDGESATYAIHCVSRKFPRVRTVVREPRRADSLLLVDPYYVDDNGNWVSHIAVLDDNGVPRFHRRISDWVNNFRWHAGQRMYSYHRQTTGFSEVVLLDERLRPIAQPRPVGLDYPNFHDFLLTDEGNYLFVVYNRAERDFSPYPDRNGKFPYSTAQPTRDSVIQEVSPAGEVLFQWNSWAHEDGAPATRISDCLYGDNWPRQYAHLNSLQLVEGDIVASFRGCSQVLKIERPSGRVLWQLGGSRPAISDGRIHYTIVGDPEPDGFCGQHTAIESPPGMVTLFDNRASCPGDAPLGRWRQETPARPKRGARVVEYRLSGEEAVFSREYRSHHSSPARGAVQLLGRGRWLVTWGIGRGRPQVGAVEVDSAGREVFAVEFRGITSRRRSRGHLYRAYREYGLRVPLNLP